MEPSYRVNAHRDQLSPGNDVFADLLKAAMAKWQDATLTHSELVGWIRSQPLSRDTSPESLADALILQGYFLAATDG